MAIINTTSCASCKYFCNDASFLEHAIPGLSSMSSAHASVRSSDGICSKHDRYLSAHASCTEFKLKHLHAS